MTLAIVFPGQGSQRQGMLSELAAEFPRVQEIFSQASDALGYNLWQVCQENVNDRLNETACTQPALLTASYAAWCVYVDQGGTPPAYLAGHSLGEYTALLCAGSLSLESAVLLVAKRGELMQQAVGAGVGKMAAIVGLSNDVVHEVCHEAMEGEQVSPANFNSPGQIVIAGHAAAVLRAMALAKVRGAKLVKELSVSVPSHCALMAPAALTLASYLKTVSFSLPKIPVISNVDVSEYHSTLQIETGLVQQLTSPVRWVETIQMLVKQGVTNIIECGPGNVLSGLNKRIDGSLTLTAYSDPISLSHLIGK